MRAYVTGGTGFVGRHVVSGLLKRGVEVTCLVRNPDRARDLEEAGATVVRGDVTDRESVARTVKGHPLVFHMAGDVRIGVPRAEAAVMRRINVLGTEHVLQEAWRAGAARIIYCSSVTALGPTGPLEHIADEAEVRTGSCPSIYAQTKQEAYVLARQLTGEGAPIIVVLPDAVYGPGSTDAFGEWMWLIKHGRVPVHSWAPAVWGYVHVEDVAEGMWLAAERGRIGEAYLLSGAPVTQAEFYRTVARHLDVPPPRWRVPPQVMKVFAWIYECVPGSHWLMGEQDLSGELVNMTMTVNWRFSAEKARRELGWQARTLEAGLSDTVAWINDNDALFGKAS